MIGTNIRGLRHLWRMCDNSFNICLLRLGENGFGICEVLKSSPDSIIGEHMFIFNDYYKQSNFGIGDLCRAMPDLRDKISNIHHSKILEVNTRDFGEGLERCVNEITLLPNTFEEDYHAFQQENSKMIKSLVDKYCFSMEDIRVKRIYIYTNGSKNFFRWAIDLYFKVNCSMRTIQNILTWNECYKQLVKKLSKGTITAYTTQKDINGLLEELSALRNEKRVNDAINSFNTTQKKLLKSNELADVDIKTLSRFSKLSEVKKVNFIKKVSTFDDFQELMKFMRHATSIHFDWNKESFMGFLENVEGIKYDIIYENDFIVLVKVSDYETIKQLGKTTNWCISKNKTYWNNYIENLQGQATQYMIFDFSKLEDDKFSIIGFTTTHNQGITSAHNFVNDNLMKNNSNRMAHLKSYIAKFTNLNNIYDILDKLDININLVAHYDKPPYEWNSESLLNYLYECVDRNNVRIILNEDNKLVLSVKDENIKYFFGDTYFDNAPSDTSSYEHIIFADFSLAQYDQNRLSYGIIYDEADEDYCCAMYNMQSKQIPTDFDAKLIEFNCPYDTIRRVDDIDKQFKDAFYSYNINLINKCLEKDKKCLKRFVADACYYSDDIYNVLQTSIVEYLSFDYLDLLYDNGLYLHDCITLKCIGDLLKRLFISLIETSNKLYRNGVLELPSEERIQSFYNGNMTNKLDVCYVGYYLLIKKIILNEKIDKKNINEIYTKITSKLYDSPFHGNMIKELFYLILDKLNLEVNSLATTYVIGYFLRYGDEEMQHTVQVLSEKYPCVKGVIEGAKEHSSISNESLTWHTI